MTIRLEVIAQITNVAKEQHAALQPLKDDLRLIDSGLDSLCIAIIVARLEDELGLDPFSGENGAAPFVTLGEFIDLYEHAAT